MSIIRPTRRGFTLIELLVSLVIIAILAIVSLAVFNQGVERARKATCQGLIRNMGIGITNYQSENFKVPAPATRKSWDTVYGNAGGSYDSVWLVAVLTGGEGAFTDTDGSTSNASDANPEGTVYVELPFAPDNQEGVGEDGKLYDPWGRELMVAINSPVQATDFADGYQDKILYTYELAEYENTKPTYQDWVSWSYGDDGVIGSQQDDGSGNAKLPGSDDVISW